MSYPVHMLSAGQFFADYRIVRSLGVGGMGEVYLAAHPRLPREDALKVLPAELTGDAIFRARFTREADLASQLDHPSIVSVYDRGEFQGQLWIAMKYIPGSDCDAVLKRDGVPEPRVVAEIVTAVADALDYAHSRGMVHRDVKPANILVDDSSSRRKVYLTDFGIARKVTSETALTGANLTVGSIQYCSPEQLRGQDLDGTSDQYALACTAFRLLTGRAPFPAKTPTGIINAHLNSAAPRVTAVLPTLAPAVDQVLARAMEKQPARRYRSCGDFAAELTGALTRPGFTPTGADSYAPTMIGRNPVPPAAAPQPPAPGPQTPGARTPRAPTPPDAPRSGAPKPAAHQKPSPPTSRPTPPQPTPPQPPRPQQPSPQPRPRQPGPQQPLGQQPFAPQPPSSQPPSSQPLSSQPLISQPLGYQPQGAPHSAPGVVGGYGPGPYGGAGGPAPQKTDPVKVFGLVAAVIAVLVVIAVAAFFIFGGNGGKDGGGGDGDGGTGDVAVSSPPTVANDPAVSDGVPSQCIAGASARTTVTSPLRNLNITIPSAYLPSGAWRPDSATRIPFAVTASGINTPRPEASSSWQASITIGTLPSTFGHNTEAIVRKLVDCLPSSNGYSSTDPSATEITAVHPSTTDNGLATTVVNAVIRVKGRPGIQGDEVVAAVIDSSPMTFAVGAGPIGDDDMNSAIMKAILGVEVD